MNASIPRTAQRPIMPRPKFPPTPAASTDITGKPSANVGQFDASFSLPPAALGSRGSVDSSTPSNASNASDSSYRPLSPSSPVAKSKTAPASRKRSSTIKSNSNSNSNSNSTSIITKDDYSLPPPPTRSRKIIQMQPKESQEIPKSQPAAANNSKAAAPATGAAGKKKQPAANTAQGRKIARKTAHSLIERRRRSKMNEEFGVLKDMIPACAGQEMHKLAILQASIEYMRYLEQCVADLKESHRTRRDSPTPVSPRMSQPPPVLNRANDIEEEEEEEDEDEDMEDAVSPTQVVNAPPKQTFQFAEMSPAIYPSDRSVHSTTTSPNLYPSDVRNYSANASPAIHPSDPHHYSLASSIRSTVTSPSIQPSPAFTAQTPLQAPFQSPFQAAASSKGSISGPSSVPFTLTSPALGPQTEREDHEATEALLMLNTDRRSWAEMKENGKRGISVNDLLSR